MPTSTDSGLRPHPAALRLRATLEALAHALAHARLEALLACETELASALSEFSRQSPAGPWDRTATARELGAASAALTRCRRLGATLADVARLSLTAQGRAGGYGQDHGRGNLPVRSLEAKA